MSDELTNAVADLEEERALALTRARLDAGNSALSILETCQQGMILVGERFQQGEYFVSELIMAGQIFKRIAKILEPQLMNAAVATRGQIVMGSVKGDIHDIGKNLVVLLLQSAGFQVHDLGVDVPPQKFIAALQETGATILGLSALLTTSFESMKRTVAAVEAAGLRPRVRVMIGGGPVNESVQKLTGADAWGASAQTAVDLCNAWIKEADHG